MTPTGPYHFGERIAIRAQNGRLIADGYLESVLDTIRGGACVVLLWPVGQGFMKYPVHYTVWPSDVLKLVM